MDADVILVIQYQQLFNFAIGIATDKINMYKCQQIITIYVNINSDY